MKAFFVTCKRERCKYFLKGIWQTDHMPDNLAKALIVLFKFGKGSENKKW